MTTAGDIAEDPVDDPVGDPVGDAVGDGPALDPRACYRVVQSRDPRFDGVFWTAVRTTGIYCRPSCPARTPAPRNVTFHASAAAAQAAGYRACRRCRPDASPGSPEWDVAATTAGRAMRLIADGVVDREGVPGLAGRLGYTPRHLTRVLGDELGAVFADLHRAHGVDLRLDSGVTSIGADGVTLPDGTTVPADLVVAGVGIRPDTRLAAEAGLAVDDGVLVDASLRSSDPDIYAAGDVANVDTPQFGRVRVEHWANALNGGPAAARAMLGQDVSYDRVPYFFSDQYDLGLEYSGWAPPGSYDQVVVRGELAAREFVAFWLSGGRILAGMNVNVWDVTDPIQALVRRATPVDPARLADPTIPLTDL